MRSTAIILVTALSLAISVSGPPSAHAQIFVKKNQQEKTSQNKEKMDKKTLWQSLFGGGENKKESNTKNQPQIFVNPDSKEKSKVYLPNQYRPSETKQLFETLDIPKDFDPLLLSHYGPEPVSEDDLRALTKIKRAATNRAMREKHARNQARLAAQSQQTPHTSSKPFQSKTTTDSPPIYVTPKIKKPKKVFTDY